MCEIQLKFIKAWPKIQILSKSILPNKAIHLKKKRKWKNTQRQIREKQQQAKTTWETPLSQTKVMGWSIARYGWSGLLKLNSCFLGDITLASPLLPAQLSTRACNESLADESWSCKENNNSSSPSAPPQFLRLSQSGEAEREALQCTSTLLHLINPPFSTR